MDMNRRRSIVVSVLVVLIFALAALWEDLWRDGRYGTANKWEYDQRMKSCGRYQGEAWFDTCMSIMEPD